MSEIESIPEEEKPEEPEAKEEEETLEEATLDADALVEDTCGFEEAGALEQIITVLSDDIAPTPIPITDEEAKRPLIEEEIAAMPGNTPYPARQELEAEKFGDLEKDDEDEGEEEEKEEEKEDRGSEE